MVTKPKSLQSKSGAEAKLGAAPGNPAGGSARVEDRIRSLGGWRGEMLGAVRRLIHEAVPEIEEDCKWVKPTNPLGVPTWSCGGIV
jgi:hypothetical protein